MRHLFLIPLLQSIVSFEHTDLKFPGSTYIAVSEFWILNWFSFSFPATGSVLYCFRSLAPELKYILCFKIYYTVFIYFYSESVSVYLLPHSRNCKSFGGSMEVYYKGLHKRSFSWTRCRRKSQSSWRGWMIVRRHCPETLPSCASVR